MTPQDLATPPAEAQNQVISREETLEWLEALDYVIDEQGPEGLQQLLSSLIEYAHQWGVQLPFTANTPYVNTIPPHEEPDFPGDREMERRIRALVRWNAMVMVTKANKVSKGIGGHISTFASSATMYDVALNHFLRGRTEKQFGDVCFFQGHASPGFYARAYVEGRLDARHLHNFRRELGEGGGLSSYPHPWLMPDFWQYPTVSMGLGPIMAIYHARFNRYLVNRGLIPDNDVKVWAFLGDGECDEPETLGAIGLGVRENLDNLIFVVNCNLQRLDGPVRGNGKIIQELESIFRGAGWNVIKVIWGSNWDELLSKDTSGILKKRMMEVLDGEYQKFSAESGAYNREHFFGKYPELREMVANMSDRELEFLKRGGLDPQKVFAAYQRAVSLKNGKPTVILLKTVKGYGLGEQGEGKMLAHNKKELGDQEVRAFRDRFNVPVSDEELENLPFYRPPVGSPEDLYIKALRQKLGGGAVPSRISDAPAIPAPGDDFFSKFWTGSDGKAVSTTMAFANSIFLRLVKEKTVGKYIVPIIPDEARTFGMEGYFREIGIYSSVGQLYDPVDSAQIAYYKEAKTGQILEEGITEAGAMSSFIAAGTAHATYGINMMPFYIYYSMFGFQRVGDLIWAAADARARGFLLGATCGRTTLNGEGLQHQDGHSPLVAATVPTCRSYHPAYGYEIAVIIQEGMKVMFQEQTDCFYYITLGNENYVHPPMPEGTREGILKGIYKLKPAANPKGKLRAQILGDFSAINAALKAQELLLEFGVEADVWSATSYHMLRNEAMEVERWNMLHPTEPQKKSYVETVLGSEPGPVIAVSEFMRAVPDMIARYLPQGMFVLGTDGFGRSESREDLRHFFETSAEHTAVAVLSRLAAAGSIKPAVVSEAIKKLGIDPSQEFSLKR
jgi:pyruvate dehydrogenase E1 component